MGCAQVYNHVSLKLCVLYPHPFAAPHGAIHGRRNSVLYALDSWVAAARVRLEYIAKEGGAAAHARCSIYAMCFVSGNFCRYNLSASFAKDSVYEYFSLA